VPTLACHSSIRRWTKILSTRCWRKFLQDSLVGVLNNSALRGCIPPRVLYGCHEPPSGSDSGCHMHLMSWSEVCKKKRIGGLVVKNMAQLNNVVLGKLSWRFFNQSNSLWASVICKKDVRGLDSNRANHSHMWKSFMQGMQNIVIKGLKWVLGNGLNIRSEIGTRCSLAYPGPRRRQLELGPNHPTPSLIPPLKDGLCEGDANNDTIRWGPSSNGEFTVKSAYKLTRARLLHF
ncbi:hypothetical protein V2J09_016753, partial [Rumex salicifolius]